MNNLSKKQYHRSSWYAKKYAQYRKIYYKRKEKLKKMGIKPFQDKPVKYSTWKTSYIAERNDRIDDIESGKRSNLGNINAKLVSDTLYEISEKKAYAIFDYMKSLSEEEKKELGFSYKNINLAIAKIRQGKFVEQELELWDKIRARRKELFDEKIYTKKEIREIVANEFFYPKEEE